MKRSFWTLCMAVFLCGASYAQTQSSQPSPAQIAAHQVSFLTQLLSLTTDQQNQATTIFTTEATTESNLRSSFQSANTALQTAVEANDANGIATAAASIGNLTTQRVQAEATASAALYAILTSDQQTKYKALLSHGHVGFGFGPGHGPGAPPPAQ